MPVPYFCLFIIQSVSKNLISTADICVSLIAARVSVGVFLQKFIEFDQKLGKLKKVVEDWSTAICNTA